MSLMIDQISVDRIKAAHPSIREKLLGAYTDSCNALKGRAMLRLAYVVRTFSEQHNLYLQGRDGKGGKIVTNADQGLSYHNYGLAADIVLLVDKDGNGTYESASWETNVDFDGDGKADWMEVVTIFKQWGFTWGGDWKFTDKPHFEMTLGYSIRQLLDKFNKGEFIPGTNYLKI